MSRETPTVALLLIGNEVLSGEVADGNLPYLARTLFSWGAKLDYVHVIGDEQALIVAEIRAALEKVDFVVTTGGIGPTPDDCTRPAVAEALGLSLARHPGAEKEVREFYGKYLNPVRLTLADLPQGAELIYNPVNKIPTFRVQRVIVLPGPPHVVQAMFPSQRELLSGTPYHVRSIETRVGESLLAASLREGERRFAGVSFGSYPDIAHRPPLVGLKIRGKDAEQVERAFEFLSAEVARLEKELAEKLRALGGE